MRLLFATLIAIPLFLVATAANADVIGFENFDGGAFNLNSTTNVFDFDASGVGGPGTGGAGGDVFGRVSPWNGGTGTGGPFDVWDDSVVDMSGSGAPFAGDTRGIAGQLSSAFFAMSDMDGPTTSGATFADWSFDISSANSLTSIVFDIAAMGDYEAGSQDGFTVQAQIDGGGFQTIFAGIVDEAASKTYRLMDNGNVPTDTNDPLELFIDGVTAGIFLDKSNPLTGLFDSYTSTLFAGQSGTTMDVRIGWAGSPSGGEPMGFDNITINGLTAIPEPSTLVGFIALAIGACGFRRRAV